MKVNRVTVKLPDGLAAALGVLSRARGLPKAVIVREALEQYLSVQVDKAGASERWVARWQGRLKLPAAAEAESTDLRLAHLLAKHLR